MKSAKNSNKAIIKGRKTFVVESTKSQLAVFIFNIFNEYEFYNIVYITWLIYKNKNRNINVA